MGVKFLAQGERPTRRLMRFSSIFKHDPAPHGTPHRWRVVGSGVRTIPEDAILVGKITSLLESNGVRIRRYGMGSPVNSNSYHIEARFLDGGIGGSAHRGFGERGTWIEGKRALTYVCELLRIAPPSDTKRQEFERAAPALGRKGARKKPEKLPADGRTPSCFACRHRGAQRTGVTTGREWCDLGMASFPGRCELFQSRPLKFASSESR